METPLIFFFCLLAGVHPVESVIPVTRYVGQSAVIRCSYENKYGSKSKYLCRGSCPVIVGKDIPIRTEAGQTHATKGRFSLHDDTTAGVFSVTITGLTAEDSGQYWCGITTGLGLTDVFTEVELNVIKESSPSPKLIQISAPSPVLPSSTSPSGFTAVEQSGAPEYSTETLPNRESALTLTYWTVRVTIILSVLVLAAVCFKTCYRKTNSPHVSEERNPCDSTQVNSTGIIGHSGEGTAETVSTSVL
ncbi:CMRF35-like molecule 8 [Sardina pilchardus]|uniref:CMRF35-like molecule 8 n=1 Tax=Sardina pilchardus TaxID=27697 RepID=UPI002E0FC8D2